MNDEITNFIKPQQWKCRKCLKSCPGIGIQIQVSHKMSANCDFEFEEIPVRRYCIYCWVKLFDEHVGQVDKVENEKGE